MSPRRLFSPFAAAVCLAMAAAGLAAQPARAGVLDGSSVRIKERRLLEYPRLELDCSIYDQGGRPIKLDPDKMEVSVKPEGIISSVSIVPPNEEGRDGKSVKTVFVIDLSPSMEGPTERNGRVLKIQAARKALIDFINQMAPNDRCAIIGFATYVPPVSKIHWLTKDEAIEEASGLQTLKGVTRLYDAIETAVRFLEGEKKASSSSTPVVVLTDGYNNIYHQRPDKLGPAPKEPGARLDGPEGLSRIETLVETKLRRGLNIVGFGPRGTRLPPLSMRDGYNRKDQTHFWNQAQKFLDEKSLTALSTPDGKYKGDVEFTPDSKSLYRKFHRLHQEFADEFVIRCKTYMELDSDPGIRVEVKDKKEGTVLKSNAVLLDIGLGWQPLPGVPEYQAFVKRRLQVFTVLLIILMIAWFLPMVGNRVFGDERPTAGELRHGSRKRSYWEEQVDGPADTGEAPPRAAAPQSGTSAAADDWGERAPSSSATQRPGRARARHNPSVDFQVRSTHTGEPPDEEA